MMLRISIVLLTIWLPLELKRNGMINDLPGAYVIAAIVAALTLNSVSKHEGKNFAQHMVCVRCGTHGDTGFQPRFNLLIFIALSCVFLLPGVIYAFVTWRDRLACRACGSEELIPDSTPKAKSV